MEVSSSGVVQGAQKAFIKCTSGLKLERIGELLGRRFRVQRDFHRFPSRGQF